MLVSTDPIADMLTRIRNAMMVNKNTVEVPHSKFKLAVAEVLKSNNYIEKVEVTGKAPFQMISITINQPDANPAITEINRVSKPGRRMYAKAADIPKVMSGRGVLIVSTSQGLMTDTEARKAGLGGELICKVY